MLVRYGRATALYTPGAPEYYKAQVNMYTPGIWRVRVEVSSSLGEISVDLPSVEVLRSRSYMSGSFGFIGVSLVLVLAGRYLWWRIRRQQGRTATSPADEGLGDEGLGDEGLGKEGEPED